MSFLVKVKIGNIVKTLVILARSEFDAIQRAKKRGYSNVLSACFAGGRIY